MARIQSPNHFALCLVFSLVLNFYFCTKLYFSGCNVNNYQLSWSQRAAEEAEAVAAVECSGHGRAYLDGLFVNGKAVCECNSCFGGPDCSQFFPDCVADADSGDPLFLEPFWIHHAASSALVVAGWHRMSYQFSDHSFISHELEKQILKLHSVAKNAVTEGKYIIFGAGSTQLISAAVYALSPDNSSSSPAKVVASIPYYPVYQVQTDFFNSVNFEFQGDASLWNGNTSDRSTNVIEFVTSPNNPDGQLKKAVLQGSSSVKAIHDHAYYWPHFTAIPAPADEDLMIFTMSKLTGHAGSRFGWAIVKDEAVYQRMLQYMTLSSMGVSRDAQLRALKLLKVVLKRDGRRIFDFAYNTMSKRWEKLSSAVSKSKRYSLQAIPPQFCNFFKKVRGPSPAYAWLKCEREEDQDCAAVLKASKIIGRGGSIFSAGNRYVRLSLLKSQEDFELILHRIYNLVHSEEDGSSKTM
ncbi:Tryptophan aminotransferase-related protein [Actinidia chinensis var. chinensis]|uniref:Tryptophan aminotransferase-related protein n=1 Tax=Actinidia chinensis var. chinensis TaxID=1590841 RepID=A0A2R6R2P7_ACTCC|nr:Tryptophan aminotransferase-related protein [Actinidia chinensis var. chinensis]